MRTSGSIEIRRHSVRIGSQVDLSPYGIVLAREAGRGSEPAWVMASTQARSQQTAEAMTGRIDEITSLLDPIDRAFMEAALETLSFASVDRIVRDGPPWVAEHGRSIATTLRTRADEHGSVLAISHAGVAELVAICLSDGPLPADTPVAFGHCDGMQFDLGHVPPAARFLPAPHL